MKTICTLNGRIIMSQDGEALETMTANAAQYAGAMAAVVTDDEFIALVVAQPKSATELRSDIELARDSKLAAGVLWNGRRWQMDDVMRSALQWRITRWLLGRLAADATLPVRAMDNTVHMLGQADHLALAEAIEAVAGAIYAESWAAKDAL